MKHFNKILASAALLLGMGWASAETVENYSLDFNTAISTSAHDFKVAPGWKHIVGGSTDWWGDVSYVSYSYNATAGVDGTGALVIGAQTGTSTTNYDYLVTPAITGSASLQVKLTSSATSAGIKIYLIDEAEDGTLTVGDIKVNEGNQWGTSLFSQDEYGTVTVSGLSGQRIGIVGYYVNIDDFVVDGTAEIEYEKALTITSVTSSERSGTVYCDQDNNYSFTYTITVQNTGEVDLAADAEGMWVGIAQYLNLDNPVATAPIGQALAIGESATVEVTANLTYADWGSRTRFDAVEGISGTRSVVTPWIEPIPYLPNITVRNENGYDLAEYSSYAAAFGSFGMVNEATGKILKIRNTGAAPGSVTITVPDGFTAEPAEFTVESNATVDVTVTLLAAEPGIFSGNLVVAATGMDDFTLTLTGTVLDTTKFFENFEAGAATTAIPAGWYAPTGNWATTSKTNGDNNYATADLLAAHKLVTPLLHATEGEKMTFEASKRSTSSEQFVKVYYSADRAEWTEVVSLAAADMEGSFSSPVFNTYVIDGVPEGDWYIAFESGYCAIDNVYGFELVDVDHDLMISSQNIPATAVANNDYTAKATVANIAAETEAADYEANFYFDGALVATAEAQEIPAAGNATFEFTFVPNATGTYEAYVELVFADGYTLTGNAVEVTVAAEQAEKTVIVGDDEDYTASNLSQNYPPVITYYKNSWSEILYTPAMLTEAGLSTGDHITSISYVGYNTTQTTNAVKVYVISTEEETMAPFAKTDVSELTPVLDGDVTFEVAGSATALVDVFTITLPEPIVWDGNSLRIVIASDRNPASQSDGHIYFLSDSSLGGEYYHGHSDTQASGAINPTASNSYFPVTKFGVQQTPAVYSGKVVDEEGEALAGVTVTLTSVAAEAENVEGAPLRAATAGSAVYTATTDENGEFTVEVVQADKVYNATFILDNYKPAAVEGISFANGDVVLTEPIVLEPDQPTAVTDLNADNVQSVKYVDAAGRVSDRPFDGLNIAVIRYADGTTRTVKVVK